MKAITIKQPWASLIVSGLKDIENRSWKTLSEWKIDGERYVPVCVKTEQVDGVKIKEDTWYELKDGVFVEQ